MVSNQNQNDQLSPNVPILRPRRSFQLTRQPFSSKNSIINKMSLARKASTDLLKSPLKLSSEESLHSSSADSASKDKATGRKLFPTSPDKQAAPSPSAPPKGLRRIASSLSLALSGNTGRKSKNNNNNSKLGDPTNETKAGFDLSDWNHDLAAISSSPASTPTEYPLILKVPPPNLVTTEDEQPLYTPTEARFPTEWTGLAPSHHEQDSRRRKSDEMEDEQRDSFDSPMPVVRDTIRAPRHASLAHAHALRSSRSLAINTADSNRIFEPMTLALSPISSSTLPPPSKKISLETIASPTSDAIFGSPVSRRSRTKSGSRNSFVGPSTSSSNHTLSSLSSHVDWQTDVSSRASGSWSPALSPGLQRSVKGTLTPSALGPLPEGGGVDYFSAPARHAARDRDHVAMDASSLFGRNVNTREDDHRRDSAPCFRTPHAELDQIDLLAAQQRSTSAMDVYPSAHASDPFNRRPLSLDSVCHEGRTSHGSVARSIHPLTSIVPNSPYPLRKRNAGSVSSGRRNSNASAWQARVRGDEMDEDEEDEGSSNLSISRDGSALFGDGRLSPTAPNLTDGTTSASSSLSTSLSSHAGHAMGSNEANGEYWTPQNYKNVKPLAAAFMSTGLITKKTRAQNELSQSTSSNGSRPAGGAPLMEGLPASTSRPSIMPDTPVKKAAFAHPSAGPSPFLGSVKSNKSAAKRPLADESPASASTSSGERTAQGASPPGADAMSTGDVSPTVNATRPSSVTRLASSAWKRQHLYRRRSSDIVADSPFLTVDTTGSSGSSPSRSGVDVEPMTPTRGGVRNQALQLVTTPGDSPATPASVFFPPLLAHARGIFPPVANPAAPRPSFPFTDLERQQITGTAQPSVAFSRPQYKARHSGSTLHSLRKRELQMPSWFETNYEVRKVLGNGAFSDAYEVFDHEREGVYAVKRTKQPFNGAKDRLRRLEEVDILRHLSADGSPHLITFVDAWEQSGHLFIQTELCENGNLCAFLEEWGRENEQLDETRVWKILTEIAAGVQHLHDKDVLHLDLKPANIFITDLGHLQIGDFGLATRWPRVDPVTIMRGAAVSRPGWSGDDEMVWRKEGDRRSRTRSHNDVPEDFEREGDREYIAPEILSGRYGKEADMFSLGLIILEAACNVVLPDNGPAWHKLRSNDLGDVDFGRLSAELVQIITGMLAHDVGARLTIENVRAQSVVSRITVMLDQTLRLEGDDSMDKNNNHNIRPPVLGAILPEEEGWLYEIFADIYAENKNHPSQSNIIHDEPTPAPIIIKDEDESSSMDVD